MSQQTVVVWDCFENSFLLQILVIHPPSLRLRLWQPFGEAEGDDPHKPLVFIKAEYLNSNSKFVTFSQIFIDAGYIF